MKMTRKQLRRLIAESLMSEMPMIKPGGDIAPDHYEKLADMIDSGDEENIVHADALASMLGHDTDSLSGDLKRYDQLSIMSAVGDFSPYLTDKDMQMLKNIEDEELTYGLYGWSGPGFGNVVEGGPSIPPDKYYEMAMRIAAKKKDADQDDFNEHEGMKSGVSAYNKLAIAIIKLSNKTIIDRYDIEDLGIGETVDGERSGHYKFWDPAYEKFWQNKKLIIRGYVEPDPWDMH